MAPARLWLSAVALLVALRWSGCTAGAVKTVWAEDDPPDPGPPLPDTSVASVSVALHGDVERLGYVYAIVAASAQGERFRLALDTSSRLTYLPCSGCERETCGAVRSDRVLNRAHESSELRCHDPFCPKVQANGERDCTMTYVGKTDECPMELVADDGSSLGGVYVLASINVSTFRSMLVVGCAQEMSRVYQDQLVDGSLGLGANSEMLGYNANAMRICLAPAGFYGGNLTLGKHVELGAGGAWVATHAYRPPPSAAWKPGQAELHKWRSLYRLDLLRGAPLSLGGAPVRITGELDYAIVDTASPFSWMHKALFAATRQALFAFCDSDAPLPALPADESAGAEPLPGGAAPIPGAGNGTGNGTAARRCAGSPRVTGDPQSLACFSLAKTALFAKGAPDLSKVEDVFALRALLGTFPQLAFTMPASKGGKATLANLTVHPREYMFKFSDSVYCVGMMEGAAASEDGGETVFGINILRGWDLAFDLENRKMRFETCRLPYGLAAADAPDQGLEDKSALALAGMVAFAGTFAATTVLLCACRRAMRRCGSGSRYEALDKFGLGDASAAGQRARDVEMVATFSIGSMDDDVGADEEDSIYEARHDDLAIDDAQDELFVEEGGRVAPSEYTDNRGERGNGSAVPDVDELVRAAKADLGLDDD
jgi:hypothetical protein